MVEIIALPFFQRALFVSAVLGGLLACMGVFAVSRRLTFFADAIGHSALTGIAIGLLLDFNPFGAGLVFALLIALAIYGAQRSSRLPLDTLLGVFFATAMAVGVILIQFLPGYQADLFGFLFGDILTVTLTDVILSSVLAFLIGMIILVSGKKLLAITFNADLARVEGIRAAWYELLFLVMLASTVALAIKLVGIILVTALVVIPAASAQQVARSFPAFFLLSIGIGITTAILGMFASVLFELPSGPTIVVVGAGFFILSWVNGLLSAKNQ